MFYILFLVVFILTIYSFCINGRDVFAPSFLICISFLVSCSFASLNYVQWGLKYFSLKSFLIIVIGLFLFIMADLIANNKYMHNPEPKDEKGYHISISWYKTLFVILFQLFVLIGTIKQVREIGSGGATDNITYNYRMMVSYGDTETNGLLGLLTTISLSISYIYIYELIVNFKNNRLMKNIYEFVPIILFALVGLNSGKRFDLIKLLAYTMVVFALFYIKKSIKLRSLIKIIIISFLFLVVFSSLKSFAGRENDQDIVTYLSSYIGGSIKLFDLYIVQNDVVNNIFGQESLYSINRVLIKLGLVNYGMYSPHLEFRSYNGINLGNVYTGFRRLIQDFGYVFGLIGSSLMGLYYSFSYRKNKITTNIREPLKFRTMLYGMMAYPLITYSINDYFFQGILSANFLQVIIFAYICSKLLFKKDEEFLYA